MSVSQLLRQWAPLGQEKGESVAPRSHTFDADKLQLLVQAAEKDMTALQQAEDKAQKAQKADEDLRRSAEKTTAELVELRQKLAAVEAELQRRDQTLAASKAEPHPTHTQPDGHPSGTSGARVPEPTPAPEVAGEPVGNAAERMLPRASGVDGFYDAVLAVDKLEDVYDVTKGWLVRPTGDFDLAAKLEGVRVIPVGQFNSGKTWLIGKLSGEELPSAVHVHTEGISIKAATADGLKIILLDTVGSNSPMYTLPGKVDTGTTSAGAEGSVVRSTLPGGVDTGTTSAGVEAFLQELRVQEDFYRQLCYEVGQVILVVVGQMSHKDQTDLVRLARTIRKDRVRKDIVVVHNLREWDMAMLLCKSGKDGLNYMERTKALFGLSEVCIDVAIGTDAGVVVRHQGLFEDEDDSRATVVTVYHYYLSNDSLPCSRNRFAIADMKATITRSGNRGDKALAEEFAEAATKLQSRFASFSGSEPKIAFDKSTSCFHVQEPLHEGAFKMKPRDLGGYFALGSDDPSYSISLLPCTAVKWTGRGIKVKATEECEAYQIQIELPGLCKESWELIEAQLNSTGEDSALIKEQLDGEKGMQWTVSFQATLLNVPKGVYQQVQEITSGEVEVHTDLARHKITDAGSRPNFRDGVRTVKVMLRTGITDYDSSQPPAVTYLDGVLGITLVKDSR